MKRVSLIRGAAVAAGLAATMAAVNDCADQKKEEQNFCSALSALDANVERLQKIDEKSTVGEVRTVQDRIETDAEQVRKSAKKMKTETAKDFNTAVDQLRDDVRRIPDEATLAQVRDRVQVDAQSVDAKGRQLAAESQCPTASL